MDITITILTEDVRKTGAADPWHERGDIVHIEPYTGLTSVHPRLLLIHIRNWPDIEGDIEDLKELYLQPLQVALDGEIVSIRDRKNGVDLDHPVFARALADRMDIVNAAAFAAVLRVKTP